MFSVINETTSVKQVIGFRPTPKAGQSISTYVEATGDTKSSFVNQCVESAGSSIMRRKAKQIKKLLGTSY